MKQRLLLILLVCAIHVQAQQTVSVKGRITNDRNEPLAEATITVSPGNKSFLSDQEGYFTLQGGLSQTSITVGITYSGYAREERVFDLSNGSISDVTIVLKNDVLSLSDVIVVGNTSGRSKLTSSVSVSTLRTEDIAKAAPRTTAEIFRSIPGIKAEASGGEGNTNITVRGVPISAGGSKYLQLQEDGLPVLQFGDMAFATSDIFLRADLSLSRIEALRGGSASVLASNSPAGIINFISKTGNTEGGNVAISSGLDYGNFRADFNYGAPIAEGLTFNVGGFYRLGEGPRTAGFTANNGGQLKFNITKQFEKGYIRLYAKYLNDRAAAYLPMPLQVTGTNSDPSYSSLPTFDAKYGTLHSPFLGQNYGTGVNGELRRASVADGMHPVTSAAGVEFAFDLGSGFKIENRGRFARNRGRFISPFPAIVGSTPSILSSIASTKAWDLEGATVSYANTGAAYTGTNAMIIHMFDVELNNFDNFVNDFKLKKVFKGGDLTFGFYKSYQNAGMSWLWGSYLTDVNGNGLRPLVITNARDTVMNAGGQFAYGTPVWGNLHRNYDTRYDISAPYINTSFNLSENLNIDAGLRWDFGQVTGSYAGGSNSAKDLNGNGIIAPNETSVESIDYTTDRPVNYDYDYASYSVGVNYKLGASNAVFARYSSGATTKADRILFTDNVLADGSVKGVEDKIEQAELGFKSNLKNVGIFVTGFYADINEEGGYEATTQKVVENNYRSFGVELEFAARLSKAFDLRGSVTFTEAEITDGVNKGKQPRRQAPFIYNVIPTYNAGNLSLGLAAIGTTSSYSQNVNRLKLKGYVLVNPFISYKFTKSLLLSVNANNVFNSLGITEAEEEFITDNAVNIIRARSVTGRTVSATIGFTF
ncbi:MAG: TonB-dependent receptor [Chitinophagaceae bacterium]|nr:TonB-dependent receptor [Chitinophagaceae bacterium]